MAGSGCTYLRTLFRLDLSGGQERACHLALAISPGEQRGDEKAASAFCVCAEFSMR